MRTLTKHSVIFLFLFSLTVTLSCSKQEQEIKTERIVAVKAMVTKTSDKEMVLTYTGSLEGEKQAVVYSKLSEAVEKVLVREGQSVNTDDVLVSLDKTGPTTGYTSVRSVFLNAEKNFKKMESLYKEGAISESQYDGARTEYEVSKANFDAVQKLVDVRAPISGVVTSVKVSPGDQVQAGQQLATVATTRKLRVKFGVNSDDIGSIQKGSIVTISSEMVPETATGTVVSVASSADPTTRTFQVEILIDNEKGSFKAGMFVKVNMTKEKLVGIIAIPRATVLNLDNQQTVFVVSNGIVHKRIITLGSDLDGVVVVTSGLNVGDTVVTLGQNYLDEGYKVNITSVDEGR